MDTHFLFFPDFLMFGPIGMNQQESMPVSDSLDLNLGQLIWSSVLLVE